MNDLQLEILNSIRNLFNSGLSSTYISEKANIAYTTVNELRNYKRSLEKVSFNTINKLYYLSVMENLNEEKINRKKRNDLNDGINVKLKIDEIIVAFKSIDLFAVGKLVIENSNEIFNKDYRITYSENNLPKLVHLDNSIFTTRNKNYSSREFGYQFNCNYMGTGPNDLLNFIDGYSNIGRNFLKEIIFNKEIVVYNFQKDEINGYDSFFKNDSISIYYYNNKLIFKLHEFDNLHTKITPLHKEKEKVILKDSAKQIFKILKIFKDVYKEDITLKSIKFINDINADVNKIYKFNNNINMQEDCYIILIYNDFEIWIPYFLYKDNKKSEITEFLNELGETLPKVSDWKLNSGVYYEVFFNKR